MEIGEAIVSTPEIPEAIDIRREMHEIRLGLGGEVAGIVNNAQQMLNWKHYVRSHPWGSLAVSVALGYFAIPRRLETVQPDPDTLAELARDNRLVVEHKPVAHAKPGMMASLASFAGNMVLRTGLTYLRQQSGKMFGQQAAENTTEG